LELGIWTHTVLCDGRTELEGEHGDSNADEVIVRPQFKKSKMVVVEVESSPVIEGVDYGWTGQQSGSGFSDLAPSILHYNWF
jgi:hypothetical protein